MVKQATGRGDEDVDAFAELFGLFFAIGAADDQTVRVMMVLEELLEHAERLHGELSRGRYDDDACAVAWHELELVHELDHGHEKGERLATACFGSAHDVLAIEQMIDGLRLNFGHSREAHLLDGFQCQIGDLLVDAERLEFAFQLH